VDEPLVYALLMVDMSAGQVPDYHGFMELFQADRAGRRQSQTFLYNQHSRFHFPHFPAPQCVHSLVGSAPPSGTHRFPLCETKEYFHILGEQRLGRSSEVDYFRRGRNCGDRTCQVDSVRTGTIEDCT